nr:immunoglobulin heavy chain junction region [Macaca mulatta]
CAGSSFRYSGSYLYGSDSW